MSTGAVILVAGAVEGGDDGASLLAVVLVVV